MAYYKNYKKSEGGNNQSNDKYKEMIINSFLPLLTSSEEEIYQWKQDWVEPKISSPYNMFSGYHFQGGNAILLSLYLHFILKNADPRFITFSQIQEKNKAIFNPAKKLKIKAGEHAVTLVSTVYPYYDKLSKTPDKPLFTTKTNLKILAELYPDRITKIPLDIVGPSIRKFNLFHASQIENCPELDKTVFEKYEKKRKEQEIDINTFVTYAAKGMDIEIVENKLGYGCCYRQDEDKVYIPQIGRFDDATALNTNLLHELAHATGSEKRLNRETLKHYGKSIDMRAKEELVAELTCLITRRDANIKTESLEDLRNHEAYLQDWKQGLKDKDQEKVKESIYKCFLEATKANHYICDKEKSYELKLLQEADKIKQMKLKDTTQTNEKTLVRDDEGR